MKQYYRIFPNHFMSVKDYPGYKVHLCQDRKEMSSGFSVYDLKICARLGFENRYVYKKGTKVEYLVPRSKISDILFWDICEKG